MDKNTILKIITGLLILGLVYFCYSLHKTNSQLSKDLAANTQQLENLLKLNGDLTTQLAQAKKDYMELGSNVSSSTQVVYVEKSSPNDADVEVNKSIPKVIVNAGDGKSFEFTPTSESKEVIKDGKVVITEDNTLTIDIEKITDARFKDRVDALNAKHELELKEANDKLEAVNKKLKITKRQRDFYAAGFATTVSGAVIIGVNKNM